MQASKSGCVLHFKQSKLCSEVKTKFLDANNDKDLEIINCYRTGNDHAHLVNLMSTIVGLGNLYKLWDKAKMHKLMQMMARALDRQARAA